MKKIDELLVKLIAELEKVRVELKKLDKDEVAVQPVSQNAVDLAPLTLGEVRSRLADLSRKGFTAQIRELLAKYGAVKLSEVDPKHYAEIMDRALEIENGK